MDNFNIKKFQGENKDVVKYVFSNDKLVFEAVLYKYGSYKKRTVICCSVQSGCPVGCTFCGTGANFISNLDSRIIQGQIHYILKDKSIDYTEIKKFQIMFMSMGEPMLNFKNVETALYNFSYIYPSAQLLISTIGISNDYTFRDLVNVSKNLNKVGLQFSIHESLDSVRNTLIPFKKKYNLRELRDRGIIWSTETERKVYLNYVITGSNNSSDDAKRLMDLFPAHFFNFTFSVLCESDKNKVQSCNKNLDEIKEFQDVFIKEGYDTRIFDPAGQDDIGGGCGQLWFVQEFLKGRKNGLFIDFKE